MVVRKQSWLTVNFPRRPPIRRPGELYENAKTLHRTYRIVRRDDRVVCSGARRRQVACFLCSFGRQLRDTLRARIGLSMHSPWMFLCETLTVRTGTQGRNKNVNVEYVEPEIRAPPRAGLIFHRSDSFLESASLVVTYRA